MGIKENRLPQVNTLGSGDYARIVTHMGASRRLPFTALKKGVFGTAENGNQGQLLRSKGNGLTEWANAGLPTDAQTAQAVSDWLDAHPEATTTVQDGSLTLDKFEEGAISFVSPEQFGAVGDGLTDDTDAWQAAVDSGYPVRATGKAYKVEQIDVTKNTIIDANGADFTYSGDKCFYCKGEVVATLTDQADYSNGQENYAIDDEEYSDYSGFAMLKGTNNFELSRPNYLGGFACTFWDGIITMPYPIDVTGVSIEIVNPVTVVIKNVGNLWHDGEGAIPYAIHFEYGVECVVESVNSPAANAYQFICFDKCLSCEVKNCYVWQELGTTGTNSYLVGFENSSFCGIRGCNLYNRFWHAATTGDTYLCYRNYVLDSILYCDETDAYSDHENAIGTTIRNCTSGPITMHAMAIVEGVTVLSMKNSRKSCYVNVAATSIKTNAYYTISDVNLIAAPGANDSYVGVHIHQSPRSTNATYYITQLNVRNVIADKKTGAGEFRNDGIVNNLLIIYEINIDNTNLNIYGVATTFITSGVIDISNWTLRVMNTSAKNVLDRYPTLYGTNYSYNNIELINANFYLVYGTIANILFNNVYIANAFSQTVTGRIEGTGLKFKIAKAVFDGATSVGISDMKTNSTTTVFNVGKSTNGTTYWQRWVNGTLTTEAAS